MTGSLNRPDRKDGGEGWVGHGLRIMRFEELLDRHERGYLTLAEVAEILGMSERTVRRWRDRYREEGTPGLGDRRIGKPSPRRAPESELARARALYAEMYGGFTVKHFHESWWRATAIGSATR